MNKIYVSLLIILITQNLWADLITQNIPNGCKIKNYFVADFTAHSYDCDTGYYLPADGLWCVMCPDNQVCPGGTYEHNPYVTQGMFYSELPSNNLNNACASNMPRAFSADFTINTYNCSAGYYLPAGNDWLTDDDGCIICPENSYCPGGTYTFNETETQGINACPAEHPFAPAGMWLVSQCGRKIHMGDEFLYVHQNPANPTQHRLFIHFNDTIYSANAVLRDMTQGVNFPKMSKTATKGLHVLIHETLNDVEGDYEYLICDDSVSECRNE